MFTPVETQRLRDGMKVSRHVTTYQWRFYFSYLLGRAVTLSETDAFLRQEAALRQQIKGEALPA